MTIVFQKTYDGESIIDASRDVSEAFSAEYNPIMNDIPVDQYGFYVGRFKLTIEWTQEE